MPASTPTRVARLTWREVIVNQRTAPVRLDDERHRQTTRTATETGTSEPTEADEAGAAILRHDLDAVEMAEDRLVKEARRGWIERRSHTPVARLGTTPMPPISRRTIAQEPYTQKEVVMTIERPTDSTLDITEVEVTTIEIGGAEPQAVAIAEAPPESRYSKGAGVLQGDFAAGQESEPREGTIQPIGDFAAGAEAAPLDSTTAQADFAEGQEDPTRR